jgi:hypothetical protein
MAAGAPSSFAQLRWQGRRNVAELGICTVHSPSPPQLSVGSAASYPSTGSCLPHPLIRFEYLTS